MYVAPRPTAEKAAAIMEPPAWKPQRARSYNERSTLPSYGSLTPVSGRGSGGARRRARTRASLRQDVWTVLRFRSSIAHGSGLQFASYVLELCVLVLILLNVVVAISESSVVVRAGSDEDAEPDTDWYNVFLLASTGVFSVEYLLRLWSCVEDERYHGAVLGRLKWMIKPLSIIDLVALVPFYLEICIQMESLSGTYKGALSLRSLRLLRILSFFRLERSYNAMRNLRLIFTSKKEEFLVVTYLTAVVVLMSSIMIFFLEHDAQPNVFSSIGVSAWWTVETITSLGYGDIVPVTYLGRGFASLLALWGIILFTIPGAVLSSGFIEVMLEKQREEDEEAFNMAFHGSVGSAPPTFIGPMMDDETDHGNHLESPRIPPTPLPRRFAHLSPCATAVLQEKLDAMAVSQQELVAQLHAQQAQIAALTKLVEAALHAKSDPAS